MRKNIKKIVAGTLLAMTVLSVSVQPSMVNAGKSNATIGIEKKRKKINNNPHIPQAKKDLINKKLDYKESIIKSKKSGKSSKSSKSKSGKAYGIEKAIENIERKISIIKANSNIPKAQKDLKIKKLENKIAILKAKANKVSGSSVKSK